MPNTIIQDLAHEEGIRKFGYGHRVLLYLPPYHPEYNAIEMAWARIKDYVGKNPNLTKLIQESIPKAFSSVNSQTSFNIINFVVNRMSNDFKVDPDPLDIDAGMQAQVDENQTESLQDDE